MKMTFSVDGDLKVVAAMDLLGDRLTDDLAVMHQILDFGRQEVVETFNQQGRPDHWTELSEATLRRRESDGNSSTLILRDTDETMLSFLGEGNAVTISEVVNHRASWGSSRDDFPYHQDGTEREPQRIILQHLPEHSQRYAQMYLDWLTSAFEEELG